MDSKKERNALFIVNGELKRGCITRFGKGKVWIKSDEGATYTLDENLVAVENIHHILYRYYNFVKIDGVIHTKVKPVDGKYLINGKEYWHEEKLNMVEKGE